MRPTNFLAPDEGVHLPKVPTVSHQTHAPHLSKTKRRRGFRRFVVVVAVLIALTVGTYVGIGGVRMTKDLLALRSAGYAAQAALEEGDVGNAHTALADIVTSVNAVRGDLDYFSPVGNIPWVGDQYRGAIVTLDAASGTASALYDGLTVFLDALSTVDGASGLVGISDDSAPHQSYSSLTAEEKYLLLHSLATALPELRRMQVNLRLAQLDLDRLDSLNLAPQFAKAVLPLQQKLPELIDAVDIVVPFAAIAPEFAGLGGEKLFLIEFLNNHELRPGGGFIGNYALLTMENGDIKSLVTEDSYAVDRLAQNVPSYHVNPPDPLRNYLNLHNWYFRDSNWSPDFSVSATDGITLMRQEFAVGGKPVPNISGAIGITTDFLERVLAFVGPITVDDETFTSENVTDRLEYIVEQEFDCANAPIEEQATCVDVPVSERKLIIKHMMEVMMDRLKSISPHDWPEFFAMLHTAFAKKEIVLMSLQDKTADALEDAGWSAALNPAASDDVVMTVDANMGAYKTDRVVDRKVTYHVEPHGNGYRATVSIKYTNTATVKDYRTIDYRTYTRVFAPLGSKLVSTSGSLASEPKYNPQLWPDTPVTKDELGLTSFGAYTFVALGKSQTLSFTYDLPENVVDAIQRGDYALKVYKQIGARDNLLTLDVDFGKAVRDATPAEPVTAWGDDTYHLETVLDTDKEFRVRL